MRRDGRLHVGDRFTLAGVRYRVVMVNVCRARAVPTTPKVIEIRDPLHPERVTRFRAEAQGIDISPYSIVDDLPKDRPR